MKLAEAQALSDLALLQCIQAVVTFKPLVRFAARVRASTNARGDGGQKSMADSLFKNILEDLGKQMPFITTEKELGQAVNNIPEAEKRSVVMRAFLGGLRIHYIRNISYLRSSQMLTDATSAIAHFRTRAVLSQSSGLYPTRVARGAARLEARRAGE